MNNESKRSSEFYLDSFSQHPGKEKKIQDPTSGTVWSRKLDRAERGYVLVPVCGPTTRKKERYLLSYHLYSSRHKKNRVEDNSTLYQQNSKVKHQVTMGVLTIYLDKATNLTNKDFMSCSDPYVEFSMEQDNWVSSSNVFQRLTKRWF